MMVTILSDYFAIYAVYLLSVRYCNYSTIRLTNLVIMRQINVEPRASYGSICGECAVTPWPRLIRLLIMTVKNVRFNYCISQHRIIRLAVHILAPLPAP